MTVDSDFNVVCCCYCLPANQLLKGRFGNSIKEKGIKNEEEHSALQALAYDRRVEVRARVGLSAAGTARQNQKSSMKKAPTHKEQAPD